MTLEAGEGARLPLHQRGRLVSASSFVGTAVDNYRVPRISKAVGRLALGCKSVHVMVRRPGGRSRKATTRPDRTLSESRVPRRTSVVLRMQQKLNRCSRASVHNP